MTIQTKKDIGDIIFFLHKHKIISSNITDIRTESKAEEKFIETKIQYFVKVENEKSSIGYDYKILDENEVFDSKEQLIESL
jgi:hypothetical protein